MHEKDGIQGFLRRVEQRVDQAIAEGHFEKSQADLLLKTAGQYRPKTRSNPFANPLGVFYLIAKAHRGAIDEQGVELASFCEFYLLAIDLLDDVQDDDLAGKPHAEAGPARALNDAMTLLFLGLACLERCMALESDPDRRLTYLQRVNRVALATGRGQHKDLLGLQGAQSPESVLAMQREKTASVTLVCECAALYAGTSAESQARYRAMGENLALLVQVLDDVRDMYGKRRSPDLESGKATYPLACFLESADDGDKARFAELQGALPDSLPALRRFFYENGTLRRVAETMESLRRAVHREIAAMGTEAPTLRLLLFVADHLVEALYTPKPLEVTSSLRMPRQGWHDHVRRLSVDFQERLRTFGTPATPDLLPWHQSQWVYDKSRGVVFYPDIEGLPEETLPFQAALLGEPDLARVAELMRRQAPAVLAHELFHHYRDAVGALSTDMWHEELAANSLSIAYCQRYEPAALAGGVELANLVLSRPENRLSAQAETILRDLMDPERLSQPNTGYQLDMHQTALVHLAMIVELAQSSQSLETLFARYLRT
jgi:geranylgeranyl pyrophosphate synthase